MRIQDYIADQTERIAESLCQFLDSTLPDRLNWCPPTEAGGTRSALQQAGECVSVNQTYTKLILGEVVASADFPEVPFADLEDAKTQLKQSAHELADALRDMSDTDLERIYNHPRAQMLGANLILMPLRNMTYHAGQINFIQTLYGDTVFHVPTNWR
jgi:uncharacterized damage-inducible protein DinB